jgi:hypothetical protein
MATHASHEDLFAQREVAESVQQAIAALPAKLRVAILLRYFEDLSYADMATALNCSIGTVASRLSRGHRLLARTLAPMREAIAAQASAEGLRLVDMFTRHVDKSLTRYSDGELTAVEERRIDAHLASCSKCRAALDEIQFSARLVRQLSGVNAPPSVWNGIDAALTESRNDGSPTTEPAPQAYVFGRPLRWAVAFTLIAIVSGGAYLWTRETYAATMGSGSHDGRSAAEWPLESGLKPMAARRRGSSSAPWGRSMSNRGLVCSSARCAIPSIGWRCRTAR